MDRILIVAEAAETQQEISSLLSLRYKLDKALSASAAQALVNDQTYDLILIDTQLSELDGFRLCAQFRSQERTQITPIILLDRESGPHTRATAFSVGANDLVKTPVNTIEFLAEISAKIQFRRALSRTVKTIFRGPFEIDYESQKVFLKKDSENCDLDLTPIEFKMFVLFTNNEGQPLSREKIRTTIWGKAIHIESRSIDKHVSSLRRKISPYENCILTTPGLGYSFSYDQHSISRAQNI